MSKTTQILLSFNMCKERDFLKIIIVLLFIVTQSIMGNNITAQNVKSYGVKKVVIDPGHGGKDPGAIGSFAKEKDIVLAVSLKLGELITKNFPDVQVIYTRSTDEFVDLYKRTKIANDNKADLFICIHANAIAGGSAYGAETFVMGLNKSEDNMRVAKLENSVILKEDNYENNYEGFDPKSPESSIIFSLYQNAFLDQSLKLSEKIQKNLKNDAGRFDRGVKQAAFLVLWRTTMPSVLIECGFITHKEEEKFLASEEGQEKIAKAIYDAFSDYKISLENQVKDINKNNYSNPSESQEVVQNQKNEPEDKTNSNKSFNFAEGIFFGIQVKTSSKKLDILQDQLLKKYDNVFEYQQDGLYKYVVNYDRQFDVVNASFQKVRVDVSDCFIVAFKEGQRFSVTQARKEVKQ